MQSVRGRGYRAEGIGQRIYMAMGKEQKADMRKQTEKIHDRGGRGRRLRWQEGGGQRVMIRG